MTVSVPEIENEYGGNTSGGDITTNVHPGPEGGAEKSDEDLTIVDDETIAQFTTHQLMAEQEKFKEKLAQMVKLKNELQNQEQNHKHKIEIAEHVKGLLDALLEFSV